MSKETKDCKVLMKSIWDMISNPDMSKEDVLKFVKNILDNNPEMESILGNISDDMIERVQLEKENVFRPSAAPDVVDFDDITRFESEKVTLEGNEFVALDIVKMNNDIKSSVTAIPTKEEARYLEDIYYQAQAKRIIIENQLRAIRQGSDTKVETGITPKNQKFLEWYLYNSKLMENQIKNALELFSDSCYLCKWAKANIGIGPVIATVLAANLEIDEGTHAASWWDYCGLNNNRRPWLGREKSTKIVNEVLSKYDGNLCDEAVMEISERTKWKYSILEEHSKDDKGKWNKEKIIAACARIPYNKNMKLLMHKIGYSFHMVKNNPNSLYGRLYNERFDYEIRMNEQGKYADQAAHILATKNFKKNTDAYKAYIQGKLPKAHIMKRCERYVTKLFISHLYEAAYWNKYGQQAPKPYVLCFCEGHTDYIGPEVPYDAFERDPEYIIE